MNKDKRIDEIFRNGLPDVGIPAPPAQDWASMAHIAHQGAVSAGVSGGGMTVRWMKLLGGTVAVSVACYLAFTRPAGAKGTAAASPAPEAARTWTAPAEVTLDPGAPTAVEAASTAHARGSEEPGSVSTRIAIGEQPQNGRSNASLRPAAAGNSDQQDHRAVFDRAAATNGTGAMKSVAFMGQEGDQDLSSADAAASVKAEEPMGAIIPLSLPALPQAADRTVIGTLELLPIRTMDLSHEPHGTARPALEELEFPVWSIAAWFAMGGSSFVDPSHGDQGLPDGLHEGGGPPATIGLRLHYGMDRRLALYTGVQYAMKGSLRGTVVSSTTLSTTYQLDGRYIEIPVGLKFIQPIGRTDVHVRTGMLLQFNAPGGSSQVVVNDRSAREMSTLALSSGSMGSALDMALGLQFPLSARFGLFVEPSYQFPLSPVAKHPTFDKLPFNPRIHVLSLAVGLDLRSPR